MEHTVWFDIARTPWWVFLIGLFSFALCYYATKPQAIPYKAIQSNAIVLLIVTAGLIIYFKLFYNAFLLRLALAIPLGTSLGYLSFRRKKIITCAKTRILYMPGSWTSLVLLVMLFLLKQHYGYQFVYELAYYNTPSTIQTMVFIYGFGASILLGRLLCARHHMLHGPFLSHNATT